MWHSYKHTSNDAVSVVSKQVRRTARFLRVMHRRPVFDHLLGPQGQASRVLPPILDAATPKHDSEQLGVLALVINTQAGARCHCDARLDALKARHREQSVAVVPSHLVLAQAGPWLSLERQVVPLLKVRETAVWEHALQSLGGHESGSAKSLCVHDSAEKGQLHGVTAENRQLIAIAVVGLVSKPVGVRKGCVAQM